MQPCLSLKRISRKIPKAAWRAKMDESNKIALEIQGQDILVPLKAKKIVTIRVEE